MTNTIPVGGRRQASKTYKKHTTSKRKQTRKQQAFKTIPVGTKVRWHYRSAIGHGKVIGIYKLGATADKTMYKVRQTDYHPGEPAILHHSGKALKSI